MPVKVGPWSVLPPRGAASYWRACGAMLICAPPRPRLRAPGTGNHPCRDSIPSVFSARAPIPAGLGQPWPAWSRISKRGAAPPCATRPALPCSDCPRRRAWLPSSSGSGAILRWWWAGTEPSSALPVRSQALGCRWSASTLGASVSWRTSHRTRSRGVWTVSWTGPTPRRPVACCALASSRTRPIRNAASPHPGPCSPSTMSSSTSGTRRG